MLYFPNYESTIEIAHLENKRSNIVSVSSVPVGDSLRSHSSVLGLERDLPKQNDNQKQLELQFCLSHLHCTKSADILSSSFWVRDVTKAWYFLKCFNLWNQTGTPLLPDHRHIFTGTTFMAWKHRYFYKRNLHLHFWIWCYGGFKCLLAGYSAIPTSEQD